MPYQDVDEVLREEDRPRTSSRLEFWLHRIFIEDWGLKLLALAITLVLWLAVTGQNKPITISTVAQLNFILPETMEIGNDPPKSVEVRLTGTQRGLDQIRNLVATVDISDHRAGERVVRLSPTTVRIEQLTEDVRIEAFQPTSITIRLEHRVEREVDVDVRLEGQPTDGYEVYGVKVSKNRIFVRGPANHVNALQRARTETIWVEGRNESFTVSQVAIDVPDSKIDLLESTVEVAVEIGERRIEKSLEVAAYTTAGEAVTPKSASVTIYGPASILNELRTEDLRVLVDISPHETTSSVELPPNVRDKVTVRSIKPPRFSVAR